MNILALDLSLTGTGVCFPDGYADSLATGYMRGMERLTYILNRVQEYALGETVVHDLAADIVVIEGYSFASKGRAAVSLGELGGVVRQWLYEQGISYAEIPPTCRAKYATGKGNASKGAVLQQAALRSGHAFEDDNAADAWWLHQMALAHYEPVSPLLVPVPKTHLEGLSKVKWVEVGRADAS